MQSILSHVPGALLVVFRFGGLMVHGPLLGSAVIPARVKVFMSFLVGIAAYPLLARGGMTGHGELALDVWTLAPLVTMELMVGVVIGYVASLPLTALQTGGLIMGQQMGLGFAQMYNPAIDDEADVLGQLLIFMGIATFLVLGGHEWMLMAVLRSFERMPVGHFAVEGDVVELAAGMLGASLELALRISAPVLALVFLETVAMGFLAKTVPQLNVIVLGFPIRILLGMGAVCVGLGVIDEVTAEGMTEVMSAVDGWLMMLGPRGEEGVR